MLWNGEEEEEEEEEMGVVPQPQQMMMGERLLMPSSLGNASATTSGATAASTVNGAASRAMDGPVQQQQQQQPPPVALKCPRCDSSNTKFCYYNNYSLSQPRHFCKACKRYWTRGGTLRNVPVGGGCRKNKRIKKPFSSSSSSSTTTTTSSSIHADPPVHFAQARIPNLPMPGMDQLMYGNLNGSADMNFPGFASFRPPAYDLQSQLNALGLGFQAASTHQDDGDQYRSGIGGHLGHHQLQPSSAMSSATSGMMQDYSFLGSSLSSATAASLLVSSLRQPKKAEDYQPLLPYEDLQTSAANGNGNLGLGLMREVKVEQEGSAAMANRLDQWQLPCDNLFDPMAAAAAASGDASSSLYWSSAMNSWPDAAQIVDHRLHH